MSDLGAVRHDEQPQDDAHEVVRDALPALLHGRVTASERTALERHLAHCAACDAERQLLASAGAVFGATESTVSNVRIDRIAAAVRARTIAPRTIAPLTTARVTAAREADRDFVAVGTGSLAPTDLARLAAPRPNQRDATRVSYRLPAWTRMRAVRAFAATTLLAVGSGALLYGTNDHARARHIGPPVTVNAGSAPGPRTTHGASGTLLGASFSDLSDSELAAVVAAVDDPTSSSPAAEPTPVVSGVLTPDAE